ncbi:sigma factor-like helix-turn-helix DNA-binding protein [Amycolatopsis sp. NPDC049688]|uniref:sigma-70 family RNA polymerase sigma factor n=1 Tax=Amycolatopsis sp. NPDC049688 TaxID=3154733 RepID=UPI00341F5171
MAKNKVVDYWREYGKRKPGVLTEPSDLQLLSAELAASPKLTGSSLRVDSAEDIERRVDVERALAPLDVDERKALVLICCFGFTQEEAAAMMGVDRGQVRRRVASAASKIVADGRLAGYGGNQIPESDTRRTTQTGTPEAHA